MSQQIDIAVDLGVVAAPLPEIEFLREFVANVPAAPPQLAMLVKFRSSELRRSRCVQARRNCRPRCPRWWTIRGDINYMLFSPFLTCFLGRFH